MREGSFVESSIVDDKKKTGIGEKANALTDLGEGFRLTISPGGGRGQEKAEERRGQSGEGGGKKEQLSMR